MMGMWRYVAGDKVEILEFLTITQEDGGPVFRLRHFSRALAAREEKDKPFELRLVKLEGREAVFEGPGTGGTLRITYRQPDPNTPLGVLERGGSREAFSFRRK